MVAKNRRSAWAWVPSLYFAQGIPYVVVMTVSVIMYKRLGISNADIALYTSWLYLPWVIKPFWSPVVDIFRTKRWWIVIMQLLVGAGLAGVALTIPVPGFFQYTLAFFWLLAFSSATHDIAADGFYMLGLKEHEQAYFVGIRSTFYRVAMITGQGLLIILAGFIETRTGLEPVRLRIVAGPGIEQGAADPGIEQGIVEPGQSHQTMVLAAAFFASGTGSGLPADPVPGSMVDPDNSQVLAAAFFASGTVSGLPADPVPGSMVDPDNSQVLAAASFSASGSFTPEPVAGHETGRLPRNGSNRMEFILTETDIEMSTRNIPAIAADSLLRLAAESNIANGFAEAERVVEYSPGWFARNISDPLGSWLKRVFGTDDLQPGPAGDTRGNVRLIGVSLSSPPDPGNEVVLNTRFQRGDGSIRLVRGDRLVFDNTNWNRTGLIAIQLDPALDRSAEAYFEGLSGNIPFAWSVTFFFLAGLFLLFLVYHKFFLPFPLTDKPAVSKEGKSIFGEFMETFSSFFQKRNIGPALAFILLYRLGEAQIVKLATPFLLDPREVGGLGLTTGDVGLIYGTIGIIALTMGGIIGGVVASRRGLKFWIFPMALAMNVPNIVYVFLSAYTPQSMWIISGGVALEQFGYGFGFTALMLYMIHFAEGRHKTAHYAFCTGFMALGMMLPGMISGWVQEIVGYVNFFIWVVICTIPGLILIFYLRIDPSFGVKKEKT
jgi:MFS transporter, PAT family, beta-lactamase induction signal transducer AmpG